MPYEDALDAKKPLSDEGMARLASHVSALVKSAQEERDLYTGDWRICQDYYLNIPESGQIQGNPIMQFPLIQPRVDALRDAILGSIFSQTPYVAAMLAGPSSRSNEAETMMQYMLTVGKLEDKLREQFPHVASTNSGIIRISYEKANLYDYKGDVGRNMQNPYRKRYSGLRFDIVHPQDFLWIGNGNSVSSCILAGHMFQTTVGDVQENIRTGIYWDVDLKPTSTDAPITDYRIATTDRPESFKDPGTIEADKTISLYDVCVKCDIKEFEEEDEELGTQRIATYWRVIGIVGTDKILHVSSWGYTRPPYIVFRVKPADYGSLWTKASLIQDLRALQLMYNHLSNLLIWGAQIQALPAAFVEGGVSGTDKDLTISPGQVIPTFGNVTFPQFNFQIGSIPGILASIEEKADAIVRLNRSSIGAQYKKEMSATEASQLGSAMDNTTASFISVYGQALEEVAEFAQELLVNNVEWTVVHDDFVENSGDPAVFTKPILWQLQGRTSASSPQVVIQKLQSLYAMAKDAQIADVQSLTEFAVNFFGQQISQSGVDPSPILQQFMQEAQGVSKSPMDFNELMRAIVANMQLPNSHKIMPPEGNGQLQNSDGADAPIGGMEALIPALAGDEGGALESLIGN